MIKKLLEHTKNQLSNDKNLSELIKGSSTSFFLKIFGLGVGFLLSMYITNTYGAAVFGQYVLVLLILRVFALIGKFGVDTTLLRFIASYTAQGKEEAARQVYQRGMMMVTVFSLFCALLLYVGAPFLEAKFKLPAGTLQYFHLVVPPLSLYFVHQQCFRAKKDIRSFSFFAEVAPATFTLIILGVVSLFSVAIDEAKLPSYAYAAAIVLLTIIIIARWKPSFQRIRSQESIGYREMLKISMPLMLSQAMMLIVGWTDTFMLGNMATNADVGIYSAAFKLSMLTSIAIVAINSIATPKIAEFYGAGDFAGLKKMVKQSTQMIFGVTLPILLVLFLFGSFILSFYGEEFTIAYLTLVMLLVGRFIGAIVGSVGYIMQMTGKQVAFQNILLISASSNILLNYFLIPQYGINGAAFSSMFSIAFQNLAMMFYIKKTLGFYTISIPFVNR